MCIRDRRRVHGVGFKNIQILRSGILKKKLFVLLVASIMAIGALTGCGGGNSADSSSKDTNKTAEKQTQKEKPAEKVEEKEKATEETAAQEKVFEVPVTIVNGTDVEIAELYTCLLYTSPSPRDRQKSRMPSSA
eukprot:TRINITY_DN2125_c0_g1_i2.p3 TRINITY_DN2125_c0_g1~~TRINITY_DN2125_c0_g1_i2.p3  ORF type:complete len:134 (-),score=38.44 TRINITY_DN2125_c0_g1_i2:24-425(-)